MKWPCGVTGELRPAGCSAEYPALPVLQPALRPTPVFGPAPATGGTVGEQLHSHWQIGRLARSHAANKPARVFPGPFDQAPTREFATGFERRFPAPAIRTVNTI